LASFRGRLKIAHKLPQELLQPFDGGFDHAGNDSEQPLSKNERGGEIGAGAVPIMTPKSFSTWAWMLPLVFASFTWGLSEIFCDACIDDGEVSKPSPRFALCSSRRFLSHEVAGGDADECNLLAEVGK
jgi:hypothetical protein